MSDLFAAPRGGIVRLTLLAVALALVVGPGSAAASARTSQMDGAVSHGNIECGGGYRNIAFGYSAWRTGVGSLEDQAGSWSLGPDYSMGCTIGTYSGPLGYAYFDGSFSGTGATCTGSWPTAPFIATLFGSGRVELPYDGTVITVDSITWRLTAGEFAITGSGSYEGHSLTITGHAAAIPWGSCSGTAGGGYSATLPLYTSDLDFVW